MAGKTPNTVPRRPDISIAILAIGGLAYTVLCLPAIERRGYPPIDELWMAMPYLWIAPAALSALFDGGPFPSRRWQLLAYALFTGFVDAATDGAIVPRHVTFVGTLLMAIFLYGPAHIAVAFVIESGLQRFLRIWRTFSPTDHSTWGLPRLSLMECLIGYSVVVITIGFPFAFRNWIATDHRTRGRQLADDDWSNKSPCQFVNFSDYLDDELVTGVRVNCEFDRATGFRLRRRGYSGDLTKAYNARIAELVREQGMPAWSIATRPISSEALLELLDGSEGVEVASLPYEVTPSIVVFKTGTVSRWGHTMSFTRNSGSMSSSGISGTGSVSLSSGAELAIATEPGDLLAVGQGSHPIFVIRHSDETVCIRYGTSWIGLFHRDGRLIESATR